MSQFSQQFIQQFEQEMFVAFQNKGGVMKPRSRRKTGIIGDRTNFPKIALAGVAQPKTPGGKVPTLDILRDRIPCTLTDFYGADFIDVLDEQKTNVEQRQPTVNAITMSLARSEDDIAANALVSGTNALDSLAGNDAFSSDAIPRLILEQFGSAEAFAAGSMYALITWRAWNDLLGLPTFANADWGGDTMLSTDGQRTKKYYGFEYAPWSRLPRHSSGVPLNCWWHKDVLGVAVGQEIKTDVNWLPDYDSWFISGKMAQGAALIEQLGVIKRRYSA
jgi:hypothetical protein